MRLDLTALVATLAATVAADSVAVYTVCTIGLCDRRAAVFTSASGDYVVDADNTFGNCRSTSVPGMQANSFCMNWEEGNGKGSFVINGARRCLEKRADRRVKCTGGYQCSISNWHEVGC